MGSRKYARYQVDYMFGRVNSVSTEFRIILARAISKLTREIMEWATKNLPFVSFYWKEFSDFFGDKPLSLR